MNKEESSKSKRTSLHTKNPTMLPLFPVSTICLERSHSIYLLLAGAAVSTGFSGAGWTGVACAPGAGAGGATSEGAGAASGFVSAAGASSRTGAAGGAGAVSDGAGTGSAVVSATGVTAGAGAGAAGAVSAGAGAGAVVVSVGASTFGSAAGASAFVSGAVCGAAAGAVDSSVFVLVDCGVASAGLSPATACSSNR